MVFYGYTLGICLLLFIVKEVLSSGCGASLARERKLCIYLTISASYHSMRFNVRTTYKFLKSDNAKHKPKKYTFTLWISAKY